MIFDSRTKDFAKELNSSLYFADYLISKKLDTKDKYLAFMNRKVSDLRSVTTMKDADRFLVRLNDAIDRGEYITIYGDYDCDGIMATCIVLFSLQKLMPAEKINWFVNNRFSEGYGMNVKGVKRLLETYPQTQLIITVDNGIRALEGIQYALESGVDVIVSDHHKQPEGDKLPDCPVVCESRFDERSDIKENFCGAELARRLMTQIFIDRNAAEDNREFLNGLCGYSGFATITDSVPMNASNHAIAKAGLRIIEKDKTGLWAFLNDRFETTEFDQDLIGFKYGPLFNAPGRVTGSVDLSMNVIISAGNNEPLECLDALEKLIEINEQRKEWTAEDDAVAFSEASEYSDSRFMVLDSESFREGINGLTASHITEEYQVPAIVLSPIEGNPNIYKGSGRSVEGINLFGLLEQCSDLMLGFGGHPMAAGLSVSKENIPLLRERLNMITPQNPNKGKIKYDFNADPSDITPGLIDEFAKLVPYGEEFEKPAFHVLGKIDSIRFMKEKHFKALIEDKQGKKMEIVWWNCIEKYNRAGHQYEAGEVLECVGMPSINTFNGYKNLQMSVDRLHLAF